ncbi:MAG TPA: hypothetical protein VLA36_03290 [Longimicrobiales bacterium]|nr:hypothetical protein [Longimicrobiales bacterium]
MIRALVDGNYQHEARGALSEKNLLAIGDVDEADVIRLVRRTRGDQYSTTPHDWDRTTMVHLFRPVLGRQRWYVKVYFLDQPSDTAVFVSVHT